MRDAGLAEAANRTGGAGEAAGSPGTAGQPGIGAPIGGVPMGTPGGGGGGPRTPVLKHPDPQMDEMHGRVTTGPGEAVRGGTIAQWRGDGDAA
ncbi:MAG TPA: hypothetical protein VLZ05_27740 [Mycobacterium sp.]|nr:hypothetical protein [Mycobacterium sp.]HUH72315.1 hypothetical protein [Mycobacterium sp.]